MIRRVFVDAGVILDLLLARQPFFPGNLDALVTRNKEDYRSAKLPILDAAECVALHRSQSS